MLKNPIHFFKSFRFKVTAFMLLSVFIVLILSNAVVYRFMVGSQFNQLRTRLEAIAATAALLVDADSLERIPLSRDGVNSPYYQSVLDKLQRIRKANPLIKYIYTMARTGQENSLQFIVDPDVSVVRRGKKLTSFPGDKYDASSMPEMLHGFIEPAADKKMTIDEWGVTVSGYAPVTDANARTVAVLGIDVAADDVYRLQGAILRRMVFITFVGVWLALIVSIWLSRGVAGPVNKLAQGTGRIARGELQYRVKIEGDDEIAQLGASFNKMAFSLSEARKKLEDYFYRVVQSLIRGLEAKDRYTSGHSQRVGEYSYKAALKLGFTPERAELLKEAAELHDIGKLGIREDALNKSGGFTKSEWDIVREHPVVGEEILKPVFPDKELLCVVRSHHESYDGKGYPDHLKGNEINIMAQIVAVCDTYDAMTSDRPYRSSFDKYFAMAELKKKSGTQFNPAVVRAFLDVLEEEDKNKNEA